MEDFKIPEHRELKTPLASITAKAFQKKPLQTKSQEDESTKCIQPLLDRRKFFKQKNTKPF